MNRIFLLCFLLFSCSYSSQEEVAVDADDHMQEIGTQLSLVKNKIELEKNIPSLSKKFHKLSELIITADHLVCIGKPLNHGKGAVLLKKEMLRLYKIHGARELIEKAQLKGLKALEKYEETKKSLR